jgi:general secretion pathway protein A
MLELACHPFPVAPDDKNFFMSSHVEQIITEIVHGIVARKGFMLLTGDVGLGKTTLTRRILNILSREQVCTSFVFHTSLQDVELLREINRDFGLEEPEDKEKSSGFGDQLKRLNDFLLACYSQGRNCAIIIDDAQNLDRNSLELVRMISNLEVDQQKLVQILLVGQLELIATLNDPAMRQLKSRVIITKLVRPLAAEEMRDYIMYKLNLAGNQGRIGLTRQAFDRLYRISKGNYRSLNIIMDRCLYLICHSSSKRIDLKTVQLALADLHPRQPRWRKQSALAAGVLLPALVALGAWSLHLYTGRSVSAAIQPEVQFYKIKNNKKLFTNTPGPSETVNSAAQTDRTFPPVTEEVSAFLKAHHLEIYAPQFSQALTEGNLTLLAEKIYRRQGLQLVQLTSLPAQVRRRYGTLAVPGNGEAAAQWLLFWQPTLTFKRFYYQYKDPEIIRLQKRLAVMRLYTGKLDGIVGSRLMKAVIAFQKRNNLPVSGFPDPATIFLLCHQQEDATSWPKASKKSQSENS